MSMEDSFAEETPETSLIHDSWKAGDGCMVTILQEEEEEEMLYRSVLMKSSSENTFSVYLIDIGISVDRKIPQLKTLPTRSSRHLSTGNSLYTGCRPGEVTGEGS